MTIAAGEITDPAVWNCACAPSSCDTLIIEHEVSHTGDLMLSANWIEVTQTGSIDVTGILTISAQLICDGSIQAGRVITAATPYDVHCSGIIAGTDIFLLNDSTYNYGQITSTDTLVIGPYNEVINHGGITALGPTYCDGQLYNYGQSEFHRRTSIGGLTNIGNLLSRGTLFVYVGLSNEEGAYLHADSLTSISYTENRGQIIAEYLFQLGNELNDPHLYNSGSSSIISYGDFYNYGTLNGAGTICVALHSENHGAINGGIDFCDATPTVSAPPFIDVNDGTVWSGVDFCGTDLCATIMTVDEQQALQRVQVVPNPANGRCQVRPPAGLIIASYDLIDAQGRTVRHMSFPSSGELLIEAPATAGIYSLVLRTQGGARVVRSVVFLP